MVLLKLLILTLAFYVLIVDLDALTCPKGQRVNLRGNGCENCPDGLFQPKENESKRCKSCTKCDEKSGSAVKQKCTKETDTICMCRGEFVPSDSDSSTCKCNIGFGLKGSECSKCEDGYFSSRINSICEKWKECKSAGVNVNGTKSSNVICKEESKSNTTPPTPNKIASLITHLSSHRPHEGVQTQRMHTTTTATTSATLTRKVPPSQSSNTGNHIDLTILIFGIIGLSVLTAVTFKLLVASCVPLKATVQTRDSLCRRPVEESGNGSLSSLKLNPEEPQAPTNTDSNHLRQLIRHHTAPSGKANIFTYADPQDLQKDFNV